MGRFISVDPVMVLTDPQQWAAYSYASNNPAFYWDPTGLWPDWLDDAASSVADGVSTAWNATTEWVYEHQADIVAGAAGALAYVGCTGGTLGWGAVACGAVACAAAGATGNMWRTGVQGEEFSAAGLVTDTVVGAAAGVITAGAGEVLAPVGQLLRGTHPLLSPVAVPAAVRAATSAAAGSAAPSASTALRPVGAVLESIHDVSANPQLLRGQHSRVVQSVLEGTPGWRIEALGRGSQAGRGWVFRQYSPAGYPTGPQLRWHPGGGHHGPVPYWRVVGPNGDLGGIIR